MTSLTSEPVTRLAMGSIPDLVVKDLILNGTAPGYRSIDLDTGSELEGRVRTESPSRDIVHPIDDNIAREKPIPGCSPAIINVKGHVIGSIGPNNNAVEEPPASSNRGRFRLYAMSSDVLRYAFPLGLEGGRRDRDHKT